MNNLNLNQSPFSFLAKEPKKTYSANRGGLAWIDDSFHLHGNNYYLYICHTCQEKQIKKGKQPNYQWGGSHE